jgi:hypothetical protein
MGAGVASSLLTCNLVFLTICVLTLAHLMALTRLQCIYPWLTVDDALLVGSTLACLCPRLTRLECGTDLQAPCAPFLSCLTCTALCQLSLTMGVLSDEVFCQMASLRLRSLQFCASNSRLDLAPLAQLQQLGELSVFAAPYTCVAGLQAVLSSCPQLTRLGLLCREVKEETALHSSSLQELWLSNGAGTACTLPSMLLCGWDLAALRLVCVRGLQLGGCSPQQVQDGAKALGRWPVEPLDGQLVLRGYHSATLASSCDLVESLLPLRGTAWPARVQWLLVEQLELGCRAVNILWETFPSAVIVDKRGMEVGQQGAST